MLCYYSAYTGVRRVVVVVVVAVVVVLVVEVYYYYYYYYYYSAYAGVKATCVIAPCNKIATFNKPDIKTDYT